MRWALGAVVLFACICLGGCSFMFMHGPPEGHERMQHFDCIASPALPIADIGGAVLYGLGSAASAYDDPDDPNDGGSTGMAIVFGAMAAFQVTSAIYGLHNGSSCSDAKAHLADRQATAARRRELERAERELRLKALSIGCSADIHCKGDRICVEHRCVDPPPTIDGQPLPEPPPPHEPVPTTTAPETVGPPATQAAPEPPRSTAAGAP